MARKPVSLGAPLPPAELSPHASIEPSLSRNARKRTTSRVDGAEPRATRRTAATLAATPPRGYRAACIQSRKRIAVGVMGGTAHVTSRHAFLNDTGFNFLHLIINCDFKS